MDSEPALPRHLTTIAIPKDYSGYLSTIRSELEIAVSYGIAKQPKDALERARRPVLTNCFGYWPAPLLKGVDRHINQDTEILLLREYEESKHRVD